MGYIGSIIAACVGLINLRCALHQGSIASRNRLYMATAIVAAFALFFPLLSMGPHGGITLIVLTVILLFPYKQVIIWLLERTARNGVKQLAQELGARYLYNSQSGFFTLSLCSNGKKMWIGNILNQVASFDKHVNVQSSYYMLGFVRRLQHHQEFNCSVIKGWAAPRYHDEEFRSRTRLLKGSFSIKKDDSTTQERITGGNHSLLIDHHKPGQARDHRFDTFNRVLSNDKDMFENIFSGEIYDALIECATHSEYYEINITPSSINIYTTLCNYYVQKINLDLMKLVGKALEDFYIRQQRNASITPCTQDAAA